MAVKLQCATVPSDLAYDLCRNDQHTISINFSPEYSGEQLKVAIQKAYSEYSNGSVKATVRTTDIHLGAICTGRTSKYVYAFVRDAVMFNLLVGKSPNGVDLYDVVYVYPDGQTHIENGTEGEDLHREFPTELTSMKLTVDDLAMTSTKALQIMTMVESLDRPRLSAVQEYKRWRDPLIRPMLGETYVTIVPADNKRMATNKSVDPKIQCLTVSHSHLPPAALECLLELACMREHNVNFYPKGGTQVTCRSPMAVGTRGGYDLHFSSAVLAKMGQLLLNNYEVRGNDGVTYRLTCRSKHLNDDGTANCIHTGNVRRKSGNAYKESRPNAKFSGGHR